MSTTAPVEPATAGTSTRYVPVAPGTEMLVRFATRAHKVLGLPGSPYMSRQATNIGGGETLVAVEDAGWDSHLIARWGKVTVQVYRGDLIFKPKPAEVAALSVTAAVATNNLETAKRELSQMFEVRDQMAAQILDLKAELRSVYEAKAAFAEAAERLRVALAVAEAERSAAVKANHALRGRIARALDARETD